MQRGSKSLLSVPFSGSYWGAPRPQPFQRVLGLPWGFLWGEQSHKFAPVMHPGCLLTRCPNYLIWLPPMPTSSSTLRPSRMTELLTVSEGDPRLPVEERHLSCLYPWSHSICHYVELVTTVWLSSFFSSTVWCKVRSSCWSPPPFSSHSWTRPWKAWTPPLGAASHPWPNERTTAFSSSGWPWFRSYRE